MIFFSESIVEIIAISKYIPDNNLSEEFYHETGKDKKFTDAGKYLY